MTNIFSDTRLINTITTTSASLKIAVWSINALNVNKFIALSAQMYSKKYILYRL